MLKKAGPALVVLLFLSSLSFGQDDGHYDFSLSGSAIFTKQSSGDGISQSATNGAGGFATMRVRFNAKHSLLFNYGSGKNSQIYQTFDNFHVLTNLSEYTAAYAYSPFRKGKFEPFVFAGGGWVSFSPRTTWVFFAPLPNNVPNNIQVDLHAVKQSQLALLYGFGTDYKLPWRFALRLQYRGLFYREPDFKVDASSGSSVSFFTGAKGHMAEPSIGLVFKF
ncbi:MAG: hypothetical protein WB952_24580 [Terriglobales bacterium]